MRISPSKLRAVALAAGMVAAPALASAAPVPGAIYTRMWSMCTTGTLKACAALSLTTTDLGGATAVVVRVTNRQGASGIPTDNTAGLELNAIRFWFSNGGFASTAATTGTPALLGGATGTATAWRRTTATNSGTWGALALTGVGSSSPSTVPGQIGGCSSPAGISPVMFTCGNGREVVFSFTVGEVFNAHQAEAFYGGNVVDGQGNVSAVGCNSDNVRNQSVTLCDFRSATDSYTSPVPEPMSIALLGTGLLGLGGVVARRRKDTEV